MGKAIADLFARYEQFFNRSIAGEPDMSARVGKPDTAIASAPAEDVTGRALPALPCLRAIL